MFTRLATILIALASFGVAVTASAYTDRKLDVPKETYVPAEGQKPIEVGAFCLDRADGLLVLEALGNKDLVAYRMLVEPKSKTTCIDTTVAGTHEVIEAYVEAIEAQVVAGDITFMMVRIRSLSGKSVAYTWLAARNGDA